jgi:hypothetical protein
MTVVNFTHKEAEPIIQKREVINFLISLRRLARTVCRQIDSLAEANRSDGRLAKKHRAAGDPLMVRSAEVIEARVAKRRSVIGTWNDTLSGIGGHVRALSDDIERLVPTKELLDILEVNSVERAKVGPADGLKEIVFVKGLEDSATHRGSLWKEGPLFEALKRYRMDAIKTNPDLDRVVTEGLFGKGGMFEFVPSYSRNAAGEFVRNPPSLRVADEAVDCKAGGV